MYLNQACCIKWNSKNSTDFTVSNVVKQGAVISPILFSAYMDISVSVVIVLYFICFTTFETILYWFYYYMTVYVLYSVLCRKLYYVLTMGFVPEINYLVSC